jgi:glycine/D-amino acid oxidase-like deaminating enzyme
VSGTATITSLQTREALCRIVIVGAGIVGAALAHYLSLRTTSEIVVFDRSLSSQNGSTGHVPGFVGQLNESNALTALAKESVQAYREIPDGFVSCGGLEVATSEQGLEHLRTRLSLAHKHNLPASILAAEATAGLAPDFVRHD